MKKGVYFGFVICLLLSISLISAISPTNTTVIVEADEADQSIILRVMNPAGSTVKSLYAKTDSEGHDELILSTTLTQVKFLAIFNKGSSATRTEETKIYFTGAPIELDFRLIPEPEPEPEINETLVNETIINETEEILEVTEDSDGLLTGLSIGIKEKYSSIKTSLSDSVNMSYVIYGFLTLFVIGGVAMLVHKKKTPHKILEIREKKYEDTPNMDSLDKDNKDVSNEVAGNERLEKAEEKIKEAQQEINEIKNKEKNISEAEKQFEEAKKKLEAIKNDNNNE